MLKLFHYFLLTDRDKPCRNIFLTEPDIIYDFAVVHTLFTKFSISLWVSLWRYTIYFRFIVFIANFSTNVLGNNSWNQKSNVFSNHWNFCECLADVSQFSTLHRACVVSAVIIKNIAKHSIMKTNLEKRGILFWEHVIL